MASISKDKNGNRTIQFVAGDRKRRTIRLGKVTAKTAEGIKSGQAVHELAGKLGVEMPITAAVVAVLAGKLSVDQLGPLLLSRDLKPEGDY